MTWYIYALTAALFFGIYFLLFHKYVHREHALEYLTVFTFCLMIFSYPLAKESAGDLSLLTWILVYGVSLLLTVFFYFIALSFKHLESSEAVPLMNLSLLFVVLFSVFLFQEKIRLMNIIGVLLMILGSYILEVGVKFQKLKKVLGKFKKKYVLYTGIATLAASITILFEKTLLNPEILLVPISPLDPGSLYFFSRAGVAFNFMIIILFRKRSYIGLKHAVTKMSLPIIITALFNVAANVSHYTALQGSYVSLVAPISALSSLIVVIIGGEMFHEHKLKQKVVAAVMMIMAAYLIVS